MKGNTENATPKRVLILGGTSGIGRKLALTYFERGCLVAVTGRRAALLDELHQACPGDRLLTAAFDVTGEQTSEYLQQLADRMGGIDLCIYAAGYGIGNLALDEAFEMNTLSVNVAGFMRVVIWCFHYWNARNQAGHFASISSVAGIRPLGVAAGYSATKHYQAFYLKALRQLAVSRDSKVRFTSIHPGFVDTDFIKGHSYPMTMSVDHVVTRILRGLDRKRKVVVVDGKWSLIAMLMRLIPNFLWSRLGVFFRGSDYVFPHY